MGDTTKGLFYACLAFVGLLITIICFFIYALVFHVKRQFVYHFGDSDSTTSPRNAEDWIVTAPSIASEHSETTENKEEKDDGADTDSLTRNLSYSNFERSQESADNERVESHQVTSVVHTESIEHPPTTESSDNTGDRVSERSFTQNPMFLNLESESQPDDAVRQENIENQATTIVNSEAMDLSETVDQSETHSEAIDLTPTIDIQSTTDDEKDSDVIARGLSFSTFEKLIEYAGSKKITDSTEAAGTTEALGNGGIVENAGPSAKNGHSSGSGNLETITESFVGISSTQHHSDHGPYSLAQGILTNGHRHETATGNFEFSASHGKRETREKEDGNNNNDALSAVSSSNTEKQVSFSGNDSTYIVERKVNSVQQIQVDGTSNFGFVKYVKEQQKRA